MKTALLLSTLLLYSAQTAAQEFAPPDVATYHKFKKTALEEIADRAHMLVVEGNGQGLQHAAFSGTIILYKQDADYDYYISNNHIAAVAEHPPAGVQVSYGKYDNAFEGNRLSSLAPIFHDEKKDIWVLVGQKSPQKYKPLPVLLDDLDLGEEVRVIGYPRSELRETMTGYVSGFKTASFENVEAIPGYQLNVAEAGGASGSGVFVQRKGKWYWAGIMNAGADNFPIVQVVPARSFISEIMMLDAHEILK